MVAMTGLYLLSVSAHVLGSLAICNRDPLGECASPAGLPEEDVTVLLQKAIQAPLPDAASAAFEKQLLEDDTEDASEDSIDSGNGEQFLENDRGLEIENKALRSQLAEAKRALEQLNSVGHEPALPVEPPEASCCQKLGMCYGDPHMVTFDGKTTQFYNSRMDRFVLVHSQTILIHALTVGRRNWVNGVAVAGEAIDKNTFTAVRRSGKDAGGGLLKVLWNGKEVLKEDGFVVPFPGVRLSRAKGIGTMPEGLTKDVRNHFAIAQHFGHGWHTGSVLKRWKGQTTYEFKFPGNVEIHIAHGLCTHCPGIDVMIKASAQPGGGTAASFLEEEKWSRRRRWHRRRLPAPTPEVTTVTTTVGSSLQSGWMGNFNGNPADDTIVPDLGRPEHDIFGKEALIQMYSDEEADAQHEAMVQNCSNATKEKALKACLHYPMKERDSCVTDICLSHGDLEAALDSMESLKLMQMLQGHGIPIFEGHGICLDALGKGFSKIEAKAVIKIHGCAHLLRTVAHFPGVRGAEMPDGHACNILVEGSPTALRKHEIPGGWGAYQEGEGQGVVAQSSLEQKSYCWKLL